MNWWQKLWAEQPVPEYGDSKRISALAKEAKEADDRAAKMQERRAKEAESAKAYAEFCEKAAEAMKGYKPNGAAFRIIQRPAGHFEIERLRVYRAEGRPYSSYMTYGYGNIMGDVTYVEAEEIRNQSTDPVESYEVVRNDQAPIKTTESTHSRWERGEREVLKGYAPLAFNAFADAEAYLFRMTQPAEVTTEYDFPPLKKRAVNRAKKDTQ